VDEGATSDNRVVEKWEIIRDPEEGRALLMTGFFAWSRRLIFGENIRLWEGNGVGFCFHVWHSSGYFYPDHLFVPKVDVEGKE